MRSFPSEILLNVFAYLDETSLARASCVCKRWAAVGKDAICRRGPRGQWLNVAAHHQYAPRVRLLLLRTPKDCERRMALRMVHYVSVALSLVAGPQYWRVFDIVKFSGLTLPLSITIFNGAAPRSDEPPSDIGTSADLRMCSEAFLLLATDSRIRNLAVESIFLPHSVQAHPGPVFDEVPTFPFLHSLRTRTTADLAWRMLSMTPRVTELTLDVVGPDAAGTTVGAATALLPRLAVLKLTFWHRGGGGFTADRDLAAVARLDALRVLDVRHAAAATTEPAAPADPEIWRAFVRSLPRLERLSLPLELTVRPSDDGMRLLGTEWPRIQHLRLNVSVAMSELCRPRHRRRSDGGLGPLFPNLQTLCVWGLTCEGEKWFVSLHLVKQAGVGRVISVGFFAAILLRARC
jgi:hypothetical protein